MSLSSTRRRPESISIRGIRPTVYFIEESDGLKQGVDIDLGNPGRARRCSLTFGSGRELHEFDLGSVPKGDSTRRVYIPDMRGPKDVRFGLVASGEVTAEKKIAWEPQRHWTVYLCQIAHFDPGYTDLPSNVMHEYLGFLDDIVGWCEQTRDWPPESRFHYTIEQAWIARHYVENRPPDAVEKFAHYCRVGQIEVNAFFANITSELLGPEQMARVMYPAFRLKRLYGIPIRTAEHNDIPGISWGYATIMADAGIDFFVPGVPDYFREGEKNRRNFADHIIQPRDCPEAFYWEAQNGRKVLVYLHRQGAGGDRDANLADLPGTLEYLQSEGYKYDVFRYTLIGGVRDNAPPLFDYAHTVREWNRKWAYPRYILGSNYKFYKALKEELGAQVPAYRGDYPGTDYTVGATSTAEGLGANRIAKDFLLAGERLAAIASEVSDYEYPREPLDKAHLDTIKYDEHTWGLARPVGWAADAHRKEKAVYSSRAAALAEDVITKSVNRIADQIRLDEDAPHIVVFNPLSRARTDVVEVPLREISTMGMPMHLRQPGTGDPHAPIWHRGTAVGRFVHSLPPELMEAGFEVIDLETRESIPHQITKVDDPAHPSRFAAERFALSGHEAEYAHVLAFAAARVPPVGYKTFGIKLTSQRSPKATDLRVDPTTIENEFYDVTVDSRTGCVVSVYDKELDRELVDSGAPYGLNQFFTKTVRDGVVETQAEIVVGKGQSGPVAASLIVKGQMPGAPELSQEVVLYDGVKRIDFRNRILKDADGSRRFYVAFPFDVKRAKFRFEGPLNVIRPIEDQLPGTTTDYYAAQHWVDVSDGDGAWGVTWSAREAPIVQLGGNWPDYVSQAHHGVKPHDFHHEFLSDPGQFKKGHMYSYLANNNFRTNCAVSQPGSIFSSYSITSGRGDWKERRARDFGWGFCCPMQNAVLLGRQSGDMPTSRSFCEVDKSNVVLLTIKRSEDTGDVIVRLLETEGVDTQVTVSLSFLKFGEAIETNVVEEDRLSLSSGSSSFSLQIGAWSLATVRLAAKTSK